jgi:hypothetical protein
MSIGHFILFVLIILRKPYEKRIDNIRNILHEILFFAGTIPLIWLINTDKYTEPKRIKIAWVSVAFLCSIFLIEVVFFLKDTALSII